MPVLLKNLRLINFKNYTDQSVVFDEPFTAVVGPNGSGKTSLLEALHYLALTKSLSGSGDAHNIKMGESFFTLFGQFESDGNLSEVQLSLESAEGSLKKELRMNGKECRRFADHIGRFPLVSLIPKDIELIWESGEVRRKFFDQWMSQTERSYLEDLIKYQHLLKNRNALLRAGRDGLSTDEELLRFYNAEMESPATRIHDFRKAFVDRINPVVEVYYNKLVHPVTSEKIHVGYSSDLSERSIRQLLEESVIADQKAGRTTAGPHLDEYHFELNGGEVRKYGSQGQQKSFLVALKLSMLHVLKEMTGINPILILDDIFDKMDDSRIKNLLDIVYGSGFGQVILTDSSPERAGRQLKPYAHSTITVDNGKIKNK